MTDPVSSNDHLEESLDIGMQILHGEVVADYVQDAFSGGSIVVNPDIAVTITSIEPPGATESVWGILSRIYPSGHDVLLIFPEGSGSQLISLDALKDRQLDASISTTLLVPPQPRLDATRSPHTLQYLVARLRDEDGCPWDREQTNASMRDAVINEAYEVVDAIDDADWDNLAEELGDLFLLIAMHSQIAEENGNFRLEDVYDHINRKIVRRHPHVFGDVDARDPEAVIATWNQVKAQEKAAKPPKREKAADGQPRAMPLLTRAARVLAKHPVESTSPAKDPGAAMLRLVSDLVASGADPESVLQDALNRHLQSKSTD